ncbi:hypothetical protein KBD81_04800 [Candidatus Woesebacteria bacterium]|nr:hypothetical protein [Candidatus Woesebacteria bacterium]
MTALRVIHAQAPALGPVPTVSAMEVVTKTLRIRHDPKQPALRARLQRRILPLLLPATSPAALDVPGADATRVPENAI